MFLKFQFLSISIDILNILSNIVFVLYFVISLQAYPFQVQVYCQSICIVTTCRRNMGYLTGMIM